MTALTAIKRSAGFSLIELVMVIVIFSVGAVTLMSSFTNVGTAVVLSEDLQIAKAHAQECAEYVILSRRDTVDGFANLANNSCDFLPMTTGYTRSVAVTTTTSAPCPAGASCKVVDISVARNGSVLTELRTMVAGF